MVKSPASQLPAHLCGFDWGSDFFMRKYAEAETLRHSIMLDGSFCFDFQKAAFGRLSVELDAAADGVVQITFSECQRGNHADPEPGGFRRAVVDLHQVSPGRNTLICHIPQHKNPYGNQHKWRQGKGI